MPTQVSRALCRCRRCAAAATANAGSRWTANGKPGASGPRALAAAGADKRHVTEASSLPRSSAASCATRTRDRRWRRATLARATRAAWMRSGASGASGAHARRPAARATNTGTRFSLVQRLVQIPTLHQARAAADLLGSKLRDGVSRVDELLLVEREAVSPLSGARPTHRAGLGAWRSARTTAASRCSETSRNSGSAPWRRAMYWRPTVSLAAGTPGATAAAAATECATVRAGFKCIH